ncbi:MAG: efflux RND transporter periplasmic adaptor subunit [Ferruginibacter sp.]|nr:efflux RND transporter periplasmic adaptor subunit [Ferruginibacter sp.]
MKKLIPFLIGIALVLTTASCSSKKDRAAELNDKKAAIEKLKAESSKKADELKKLQDELAKSDTANGGTAKEKLVATTAVTVQNFTHYIDLQGKIDADNISYISPRMGPGQVKAIFIKEGQMVKKGQLVLKLDDAIIRQQVQAVKQQAYAAKQQLEGIRTQLAFAKNIYTRQNNLWQQGIGTEVQLITAKTSVQGLENQLVAATEQVKAVAEQINVANAQLNTANVYSDVSGVAEQVNIRIGETFTGMSAMGAQIKIVNTSSLKVVTSIPENYLTRLRTGTPAEVTVTDINRVFNSSISLISQSVDANRGFTADIKIPFDVNLKPNQSAKVRIMDYSAANVIVIPINVVQTDEVGKYVYVLVKSSNGKATAQKKNINIGEVYGDKVEVKTGLTVGDLLITEGYQSVYEGQGITNEIK